MLIVYHNILQQQLEALKIKATKFYTFTRLAQLLSGKILVNQGQHSNSCDSCGERENKRCLCCIKYNLEKLKKRNNTQMFE